jgi:nucleotide-binding universal stress UspA family protein
MNGEHAIGAGAGNEIFRRIVAGVDGSDAGFEAVQQATRLVTPDGSVELITAVEVSKAILVGPRAPVSAAELEFDAHLASDRAVVIAGPHARARIVRGAAPRVLFTAVDEAGATLIAVGTHGHSRAAEILLGGVAGELLHAAPCSVLIARKATEAALFPRALVVGVDDSHASDRAVAAAEYIADRFGASLAAVSIGRIKRPVRALVDASDSADLLIVGAERQHGLKALTSVSERVGHLAGCSVLVVRPRSD